MMGPAIYHMYPAGLTFDSLHKFADSNGYIIFSEMGPSIIYLHKAAMQKFYKIF